MKLLVFVEYVKICNNIDNNPPTLHRNPFNLYCNISDEIGHIAKRPMPIRFVQIGTISHIPAAFGTDTNQTEYIAFAFFPTLQEWQSANLSGTGLWPDASCLSILWGGRGQPFGCHRSNGKWWFTESECAIGIVRIGRQKYF